MIVVLGILPCVVVSLDRNVYAAAPTEYQLKAAFLFNFAKFIDWPPVAFRNSQSPFAICVLGEDPYGRDLDETIKGQTIDNRNLVVRRVAQASRDDSCQILFVSSSESGRFGQILNAVRSLPVLTVGEDEEFRRAGGIIFLVVEEKRVRFDVNLDAGEQAGVKFSSRLLKLARAVHERKKN